MTSYRDVLSQSTIDDYGPEFLQVVEKVADAKAYDRAQQVREQAHREARASMCALLDQVYPQWRQVNDDPRFLDDLGKTKQADGKNYHTVLTEAWNRNDTARVLSIFQSRSPDGPDPRQQNRDAMKAASDFQYGRANPGTTMTKHDVQAFYTDVGLGRYKGREDEQRRIEDMIMRAGREGKIK